MVEQRPVTICVIDDIEPVVDGICSKIDWSRHGIAVAGGALNGEDGLELIAEHKPDIIVTDIRMPVMNGLELAQEALKQCPRSKIILISGYHDFEYAQQALRLGVFDYIVKPFSLEEMEAIVLKAKEQLLEERNKFRDEQQLRQKVKESLPLLRQEYFNLILHHGTSEERAMERWKFLGIRMEPKPLVAMVVEIDQFAETFREMPIEETELIRFSLQNIVEETVCASTRGELFKVTPSRFVCIMNPPVDTGIYELAEACRENIEAYTKFTVTIGLGEPAESLGEVRHSYHRALQAIGYQFYTGGNSVISSGSLQGETDRSSGYHLEREHELFFAFRKGNIDETLALLNEVEADIANLRPFPRPEYLSSLYYEIIYMLLRILQEKASCEQLSVIEHDVDRFKLESTGTLSDLRQLLRRVCAEGCSLIEKSRISEGEHMVGTMQKYIRENLHLNLTTQHCARIVHMSGSYFTNVFKKVTGLTLSQYVTQMRMEKAMEMLLDGHQVQEIAGALGYEDRRYFSDAFKKQTGLTPSEYKQSASRPKE